jgi:hypothetical protein
MSLSKNLKEFDECDYCKYEKGDIDDWTRRLYMVTGEFPYKCKCANSGRSNPECPWDNLEPYEPAYPPGCCPPAYSLEEEYEYDDERPTSPLYKPGCCPPAYTLPPALEEEYEYDDEPTPKRAREEEEYDDEPLPKKKCGGLESWCRDLAGTNAKLQELYDEHGYFTPHQRDTHAPNLGQYIKDAHTEAFYAAFANLYKNQ